MSKVTYLFGAGASALALPVVKDIPSRLHMFRSLVHDNRTATNDVMAGGVKRVEAEENFLNECDEIINLLATRQPIGVSKPYPSGFLH